MARRLRDQGSTAEPVPEKKAVCRKCGKDSTDKFGIAQGLCTVCKKEYRAVDELKRTFIDETSASGIAVGKMKPFYGVEDLPPAMYEEQDIRGTKTRVFVAYGEPRFFVNQGTEVIMVFRGNQRTERRLFARIKLRNEKGPVPEMVAFQKQLREARIPGA